MLSGRIIFFILAVACIAGAFAGCGPKTPGGQPPTGRQATPEPTAVPEELTVPENIELSGGAPARDVIRESGVKMVRRYYRKSYVVAVPVGKHYGFWGLAKAELSREGDSFVSQKVGDRIYTTAFFIANAFGMRLLQDDVHAEFTVPEKLSIRYEAGIAKVSVNGAEYPSYPAQKSGSHIYIDCESFASILGYKTYFDDASGIFLMYAEDIAEDVVADPAAQIDLYRERIDLYEKVVFNVDDVECDTTGAGLYEPVPFDERQVGIAYTTWFRQGYVWGKNKTWDLPMLGQYRSEDEDIIYQHGVWLANAGVDFVFVDWSNNINYDPETMRKARDDFRTIEESTELLFKVWSTIPGAPKICIFTGPGHVQEQADCLANGRMKAKNDQIYETFVADPEYGKMYYYYEGKPLLICYGATPSFASSPDEYVDDRFTIRWMTGYVGQQGNLHDKETKVSSFHWSWEERGAQTFAVHNGRPEAMTVVAAWRKQGKEGGAGYIPAGLRDGGNTFKKQWQRADLIGPKFALIVSFNEWSLGEQVSFENSKDIEPSAQLGSLYLDIMAEQIKKFKGR